MGAHACCLGDEEPAVTDPVERTSRPQGFDDPTRDIRLPPAPGSPPLVVRPEWSSYTARQEPVSVDSAAADAPPAPTADLGTSTPRRPQDALADEPTDQLVQPGAGPRERTLEFSQGQVAARRPAVSPTPVVPRQEPSRRWPWVVMALLPIIVIVGSGIWLFILLSHA
jgi:hypothetical protein